MPDHKSALIRGVTDLLVDVLDKSPTSTFVVIDEVAMEDCGIASHVLWEIDGSTDTV